jgi:hypothetical protein
MHQRRKLLLASIIVLVVLIPLAFLVFSNLQNRQPGRCNPKNHIAKVNETCILKESYQKMLTRAEQIAKLSPGSATTSGSEDTSKQVLDQVIELEIISQYARQNNIEVKDSEVEQKYQLAVKSVGTEGEYLDKLKTLQGIGKDQVLELIRLDILREKVRKSLKTPLESWLLEQKVNSDIEVL